MGKILYAVILISLISAACAAPAAVVTPVSTGKAPVQVDQTSWQKDWEATVAEARKEGKVMVYSSQTGEMLRSVSDAFKQKYGIEMEFISGRGEEITQRMQTENAAGLYLADIVLAGDATLITTMKPLKLLGKMDSMLVLPEVLDARAWNKGAVPFMDQDHTSLAMVAVYQRYVLRNNDLVKDGEITSYMDLLNPKWKGKMVLADPTVTGSTNGMFTMFATDVMGLEGAKDYMRKLVAQEPLISRDKRLPTEWVAKAKYPISIGPTREVVAEFSKLGAPVSFVPVKEGGKIGTAGAGLGTAAKTQHPNATKLFVNWILSKEGSAVFVKSQGQPGSRLDSPKEGIPPEFFAQPGEKVWDETEQTIMFREPMLRTAKEIFAPLLK